MKLCKLVPNMNLGMKYYDITQKYIEIIMEICCILSRKGTY